ncbi:MAG: hypothetical protein JSU88_08655 [Nitrospinaceae bacterium]|nr:MAG: hypothetical protein JSU88_08655 [Nitrospinaceae bacterium]
MPIDIVTAYLAPEGLVHPLVQELNGETAVHGRLVLSPLAAQKAHWAENVWLAPKKIPVQSISDAARKLKALQRNWWLYSFHLHRRAALIQEQLPHVSARPLFFPAPLPASPLGSWTLLDAHTLLASARCTSPFPNGTVNFVEDREGPPSRAYLKLWETWTRFQRHPRPGEFCLDAGGSPGGWAWAAAALGARVLSVDRAPLAPKVMSLPGVSFQKGDIFSLKPETLAGREPVVHWLLSDVICYPEKLFDWVVGWLESGMCENFICTLKFQDGANYAIANRFADLPGGQVLHLYYNKHELTWVRLAPAPTSDTVSGT